MAKLKIERDTWDLSPLLAGDDDPNIPKLRKEIEKASYAFIDKWKDRDDFLTDTSVLKEALDEYEAWSRDYGTEGHEGFYFGLRLAQDEANPELKAKNQQVTDFGNQIWNDIQFFELRLAKAKPDFQKEALADDSLKPYRHFLEMLFASARYQLSESEEKIMTLKSATSYSNWVNMLSGFLAKAERNGKTHEELLALTQSRDKAERDKAAADFNDILAEFAEVAENELNSVLGHKKVNDELRGFERPDSSRHLSDDVETAMVDTLVEAVSKRNDIPARFYQLKAKLLGLPKLAYHERNVEYGSIETTYSFEEAVDIVHEVCRELDPEFAAIFEGMVKNGQIDVYPRKGKGGGAFCAYGNIPQPTYLLLNFTGKLRDVTTLAHELGHGINSELMKKIRNALDFGTPMATAEVASQFMEDFVLDRITETADDETKLAINMSRLNDSVSSIFRQIACYRFELDLHNNFRQQGYLSKDDIGQLFQKNMSAYMGKGVEQSPGSENWWVYWSHIRTYFYVYAYAGGLLVGTAMQAAVRENKDFMAKVKRFLEAGRSDSPANLFGAMDIDVTKRAFWDTGLENIDRLLKETEELAGKLGKL